MNEVLPVVQVVLGHRTIIFLAARPEYAHATPDEGPGVREPLRILVLLERFLEVKIVRALRWL